MGFRDQLRAALGTGLSSAVDAFYKAAAPGEEEDFPSPPSGDTLAQPGDQRAPQSPAELGDAQGDPKSLFWDPFSVIDALGFKDRPSSISYETLQAMIWRMPIIHSILITRQNQIANFAIPQPDRFTPGFRVRLADKKAEATEVSEAKGRHLESWLLSTGKTENPEGRDDFETFLRKLVRDSLTYDQACVEVVPDRAGRPAEFYAVDGKTIRIADTTKLRFDEDDTDQVRYVQIYDGLVVAEYSQRELCFGVRNPTTDIRNQNYGHSELEMLISTVTSLLWAWDYNQKFFSQGTTAKGIINFKGAIPEKQLRAFRRFWYGQVAGVENAFRQPITNADELQWINMQQSNREMEFSAWFDFLIKVATSMYGMDPMEINFKYGDSGSSSSMFESANQSKLAASKDKGLKPLLRHIQRWVNLYLIHPVDPDYTFEFVGLEAQTPAEQADLQTKQVKTYKTINEIRAEDDMEPLPPDEGDIILDPVWMQAKQMKAMQDQQAAMGDEEGDDFSDLENDLNGKGDQAEEEGEDKGGGTKGTANPFNQGAPGQVGGKASKPAEAAKPAAVQKAFAREDVLRKARPTVIVDLDL